MELCVIASIVAIFCCIYLIQKMYKEAQFKKRLRKFIFNAEDCSLGFTVESHGDIRYIFKPIDFILNSSLREKLSGDNWKVYLNYIKVNILEGKREDILKNSSIAIIKDGDVVFSHLLSLFQPNLGDLDKSYLTELLEKKFRDIEELVKYEFKFIVPICATKDSPVIVEVKMKAKGKIDVGLYGSIEVPVYG